MSNPFYFVSQEMAHWISLAEQRAIRECWDDHKIMSLFNGYFGLRWNSQQMYDTVLALKRSYGPFPQAMEFRPWYNNGRATELRPGMDVDTEAWAMPSGSDRGYAQSNEASDDIDDYSVDEPTDKRPSTSSGADSAYEADSEEGPRKGSNNGNRGSNRGQGNGSPSSIRNNRQNNGQDRSRKNSPQGGHGNGKQNDRGQNRHSNGGNGQQNSSKGQSKTCNNCGKSGHLAKDCRNKATSGDRGGHGGHKGRHN